MSALLRTIPCSGSILLDLFGSLLIREFRRRHTLTRLDCSPSFREGSSQVQGLSIATPVSSKSATFLVTTVMP